MCDIGGSACARSVKAKAKTGRGAYLVDETGNVGGARKRYVTQLLSFLGARAKTKHK